MDADRTLAKVPQTVTRISISHAFNSAMCKIYKVKFQLLDCIYDFTNQRDIVQDISSRRRRFELKLLSSNNSVIKLLHASS